MHYILGDVTSLRQALPADVRLDSGVPILAPTKKVNLVTYRVQEGMDDLDVAGRALEIAQWCLAQKVPVLRTNSRMAAGLLASICGGRLIVQYDADLLPSMDWWPGPNYLR